MNTTDAMSIAAANANLRGCMLYFAVNQPEQAPRDEKNATVTCLQRSGGTTGPGQSGQRVRGYTNAPRKLCCAVPRTVTRAFIRHAHGQMAHSAGQVAREASWWYASLL